MLENCGVTIADDIKELGCTGVWKFVEHLASIEFLRLGLAGSGVGLPCFVPPTLYCLAHDTIGGLQDGQELRHKEYVGAVSRPLKPHEQAHLQLIQQAQRVDGKTATSRAIAAMDLLAGRELPDGWEKTSDLPIPGELAEGLITSDYAGSAMDALMSAGAGEEAISPVRRGLPQATCAPKHVETWTCPDHGVSDFKCRFCVAAAIAAGAYDPACFLHFSDVETPCWTNLSGVVNMLATDDAKAHGVDVYVLAASWKLRLSRV